jgi:hypothetical protein
VFITGCHFHPSLIFSGKGWSLPEWSPLQNFTLRVGYEPDSLNIKLGKTL